MIGAVAEVFSLQHDVIKAFYKPYVNRILDNATGLSSSQEENDAFINQLNKCNECQLGTMMSNGINSFPLPFPPSHPLSTFDPLQPTPLMKLIWAEAIYQYNSSGGREFHIETLPQW